MLLELFRNKKQKALSNERSFHIYVNLAQLSIISTFCEVLERGRYAIQLMIYKYIAIEMQLSTENMANDGKICTVTYCGDTRTKRAYIPRWTSNSSNSSGPG